MPDFLLEGCVLAGGGRVGGAVLFCGGGGTVFFFGLIIEQLGICVASRAIRQVSLGALD